MYASVVKSQPFRTKVIFRFFMTQDVSFLPVFSVFRYEELEQNIFRQIFPSRGVGVCRDSAVVPLKWMCLVSWQIQQHNRLFFMRFYHISHLVLIKIATRATNRLHSHALPLNTRRVSAMHTKNDDKDHFIRLCPRGAACMLRLSVAFAWRPLDPKVLQKNHRLRCNRLKNGVRV